MTHVIFGQPDDQHVIAVAEKLNNPIILDDKTIEYDVTITAGVHSLPAVFVNDELIAPYFCVLAQLRLRPI